MVNGNTTHSEALHWSASCAAATDIHHTICEAICVVVAERVVARETLTQRT